MFPQMLTQGTILHLFIAVGLAVHAMKTGRSQWWLFILLLVPLVGSIAYVVIELIPALFRSQGAQKVAGNIGAVLDPDKEWRERARQAELVDFGRRQARVCGGVREEGPMGRSDPPL